MPNVRAVEAVLFDFNGTLSDDEPLLLKIFAELFAEHLGWPMTPRDYYDGLAGRSDREIVQLAVARQRGDDPELVESLLAARRERYLSLVADESPVRPGTLALVDELGRTGLQLGIVTGAQRPDVLHVLETSGIAHRFAVVVTEEDVLRGKPDPEGFLAAAAQLDVSPDAVVVLEDSVAGVRAAHAAGMACIGLVGTRPREVLEAEGVPVVDELGPAVLDLVRARHDR